MLGSNVLVIEALGFLGAIGQHALALMAQRKIDRGRYFFAQRGMRLDLLADRLDRRARAEEAVGKGFILAQQPQQQMFGLNARATKLAGFIPGEEDYPASLFGITFKHNSCSIRNRTDSEEPFGSGIFLTQNLVRGESARPGTALDATVPEEDA